MRYKQLKPTKNSKRLSKIFSNEQFNWVKRIYPHFSNPELSDIIFKRFGIKKTPKSLENLAYRQRWYKTNEEISEVRSKNAYSTNEKRWGKC